MTGIYRLLLLALYSLIFFSSAVQADDTLPTSTTQFTSETSQQEIRRIFRYSRLKNGQRGLVSLQCQSNDKYLVVQSYTKDETSGKIVRAGSEGCLKYYDSHYSKQTLTTFDEQDLTMVQNLNKSFYPKSERLGTVTFQHGHPTEKIYVFIPGLYLSSRHFMHSGMGKFLEGNNVIIATLPGHERWSLPTDENALALWLAYIDYIGRIARQYGKHVIYVGHSLGGNLAIHAAENGYADELILLQPLLDVSRTIKTLLGASDLVPDKLLKNTKISKKVPDPYRNIYEIVETGRQARLAVSVPFVPLSPRIPVSIYADKNDSIVSTSAITEWAQEFAPQSTFQFHSDGHMHNPF